MSNPLKIVAVRISGFPQFDGGTDEKTIFGRIDHPYHARKRAVREHSRCGRQYNLSEQTYQPSMRGEQKIQLKGVYAKLDDNN